MKDRETEVLLAMQQALLGEVSAPLRVVAVFFDDASIHFDCYFDGEISEEDRESMSCVETEMLSAFPPDHKITSKIHRLDFPAVVPKEGHRVYSRREQWLSLDGCLPGFDF